MTLTFQKEWFAKVMPELPEIFLAHWQEVGLDRDRVPLDPDWNRYLFMEVQGFLHMTTVRDEGRLVGYYVAIIMPHLHYKTSLTAFSDIFYLRPEYRWGLTGYKLFTETEKYLKALKVQKSYVMTKAHLPINMIMKRLKYKLIERIFTKLL